MRILIFLIAGATLALSTEESSDKDGEESRKILGSSVVTSVSVIMDTGNGSKAVYTDAVGKPVPKPSSASELASPIDLLNPDRYEFYTFDDNGDLIKRLMSLEEIQGIIATGDSDGYDLDSFTSLGYLPEKRVNDVVNNVQNVLKEEIETHKNQPDMKPMFDTPDVSDSWSMILPAVFGNSGEDIKPEKPIIHVTPDTIMIEPNSHNAESTPTSDKIDTTVVSTTKPPQQTYVTFPRSTTSVTTPKPTTKSHISEGPSITSTSPQMSTIDKLITLHTAITNKTSLLDEAESQNKPAINVEIISNSQSTEKPLDQIVEVKSPDTIKDDVTTIGTQKPFTTQYIALASVKPSTQQTTETKFTYAKIEDITKSPTTIMTFVPSSLGSTLPTTKTSSKPTSTPLTTFELITQASTMVRVPALTEHTSTTATGGTKFTTAVTESATIMKEVPIMTSRPKPTTQETSTKSEPAQNLPTLAELLNLSTNTKVEQAQQITVITTPENPPAIDLTTFSVVNGEKIKEEITTTEYIPTTTLADKSEEDLSTLSSEYLGSKNKFPTTYETAEATTQLTLEQSMNTDQKLSANELLDQLLFTTNIYEINTELAKKPIDQQSVSSEDDRFESSTQEESVISEVKTEIPTTEQFLIKIGDNTEQPTTDRNLIDSIEQLLSQAVGSVEEAAATINNTEKVQDALLSSGRKNMTEVQMESATVASDLIGINADENDEDEQISTETSPDDTNILNESLGSLLSQVYNSNQPNVTTFEYVTATEKYPITTTLVRNSDDTSITSTGNIFSTEKYEAQATTVDITEKYEHFERQETTTLVDQTTSNYMPLASNNNSDSDKDYTPHLINITIISSEGVKDNANNRTKPSKADTSLEQMFDEINKNMTAILTDVEPTEIYIERSSSTTEKLDRNLTIGNSPIEILKTDETMAALYNNSLTNKNNEEVVNDSQNISPNETTILLDLIPEDATEISTEDDQTVTTISSFTPVKETQGINDMPTTIIIIKRTERPFTQEPTTVALSRDDESSDVGTDTTTLDNKLETTTFVKQDAETTEPVTEKILQTTTQLSQEEVNTESITEISKQTEPSVDIIISETNKPLTAEPHSSNNRPVYVEPPNSENSNQQEDENKPQQSSSADVKVSTDVKENTDSFPNKVSENEKTNKGEVSAENKPESTWTLVPTIAPHSDIRVVQNYSPPIQQYPEIIEPASPIDLEAKPLQGFGLEDSTSRLDTDIYQFAQLCNELAFGFWKTVTGGISSARSVFVSPFGATSLLAMVFLGARGATSGEMNEILKLDDMVTFNPHLIFKNVSESIRTDEPDSGVSSSAIIRELFSDRSKGKLLPFYKERVKAFYDGYVEEVSFREIGDVIRRRTNLQVKKFTNGKMAEFLKDGLITTRPPLAGVSVNVFHTDCSQASTDGRDGELHFVVLPSIRQRRLIPVPAVVYRSGFLAGYEPSLDATAVSLGTKDQTVSTILVIPGQQGIAAPGDGLARLERRLVESSFKKGAWSRLLRCLIPRPGLEVQIPRFSHRSIINATITLKKMGLHDLFDVEKADLRGLNGVANELFLSDMLQINSFATCGERRITDTHHSEIYPASATRASRYLGQYQSEDTYYRDELLEEPRDYQRAFHDPLHDPTYYSLPLSQRPRQARVPETPRLRFDRPFIYFIRHNPTGLILHMGRFNPRLLP